MTNVEVADLQDEPPLGLRFAKAEQRGVPWNS